jgi:hypothetical protein
MTPKQQIRHYLRTGTCDQMFFGWPGRTIVEQCERGRHDVLDALVAEVHRRTRGRKPTVDLPAMDLASFTRRKIEPMVRGLFRRSEQEIVIGALERSVVFLTPENIEQVLRGQMWTSTAWDLANLYLGSLGARRLSASAPNLAGLGEGTTSYVSMDYFARRPGLEDFVLHEVAHVFHNCRRRTIGLAETRTREWLLDIEYRKRELFAYACEAYGCILEKESTPAARRALLDEVQAGPMPNDERVDAVEYVDVLREAVDARNGWKRILGRCSPAGGSRGSEWGEPVCGGRIGSWWPASSPPGRMADGKPRSVLGGRERRTRRRHLGRASDHPPR